MIDILALYKVNTIIDTRYLKGGKYDEFLQLARAERANGRPAKLINLREFADSRLDDLGDGVNARFDSR